MCIGPTFFPHIYEKENWLQMVIKNEGKYQVILSEKNNKVNAKAYQLNAHFRTAPRFVFSR